MAKSHEATPFGSKDPSSNTLHFKPIFDSPLKKVVRGAPAPSEGCASKTWSFSSACKNLRAQHPLGAEIWSSEKCTLGGYDSTSRSPRSLDQTSPDLFRLTQEESRQNFLAKFSGKIFYEKLWALKLAVTVNSNGCVFHSQLRLLPQQSASMSFKVSIKSTDQACKQPKQLFAHSTKLQQQICCTECNTFTSWTARSKLRVEVKGIVKVAHDGLERRNYETPVQAVPVDCGKERMTFYITHSTQPGTWPNNIITISRSAICR